MATGLLIHEALPYILGRANGSSNSSTKITEKEARMGKKETETGSPTSNRA